MTFCLLIIVYFKVNTNVSISASTNFRIKEKRRLLPYAIRVYHNLHFLRKSLRITRTHSFGSESMLFSGFGVVVRMAN